MKFYFVLLLVFIGLSCKCQTKKNTASSRDEFSKFRKEIIQFDDKPGKVASILPFSSIYIIDKRFDTASIGYMKIYRNVYDNYRLVTENNFTSELGIFLNSLCQKNTVTDSFPTLVIVLRKFWFYKDYEVPDNKFFKSKTKSNCLLKLGMDCFLYKDTSYMPLLRRDTVLVLDEISRESMKGTLVSVALQDFFKNLFADRNIAIHGKKRPLGKRELEEYYNKNFSKPILTHKPRRGVYMSFDEFIQNAPSQLNFEVKNTDLADDIYLISDTDTIPSRSAWGYCDGEKIFIKAGMNLFELIRQGSAFAFVGNSKLTHKQYDSRYVYNNSRSSAENLAAAGLTQLFSVDKFTLQLFPMLLDMDTGEVY
ncbi:MAG: hypothetical protein ABIN25_14525 [Ginsengibacter sp.]